MSPKIEDYALVVNDDRQILLIDGVLPRHQSDTTHFWQSTIEINTALQTQFGIQACAIRCLHNSYDDGTITNYYLMTALNPPPPGATWSGGETVLRQLPDAVGEGLHWLGHDHPLRVPWYYPGWFTDTAARLRTALGDVTGPLAQLRSWQRSSVLRVPTSAGDMYAKGFPAFFAHEGPLTRWLGEQFPEHIPPALAKGFSDSDNLLLLKDYGGQPLSEVVDVTIWESALRHYAAMQVRLTQSEDKLMALGCPRRDLDWLRQSIETLLTDPTIRRTGVAPLSAEESQTLQMAIPQLEAMCDELASLNIPLTLEHGDLWSGQVIISDTGQVIITDWSDSAITHPFFSLPFFLAEIELKGVEERLIAAYLEPWRSHSSSSALGRALALTSVLSPLYSAVVYHQHILPNMEIQWEMENMMIYNLRLLLSALASDLK